MEPYSKIISKEGEPEIAETRLEAIAERQKEALMELLRNPDLKEEERSIIVNGWTERQKRWAGEGKIPQRRMVIVETARTDLYLALGDAEGAFDTLDGACTMAQQEGYFDLLDMAEKKMDAINKAGKSSD